MRMDPNYSRNHMETYYGHVKSPNDAIILFEACRLGSLPRVQRRLSEKERQQIRSGSVFVWDEREAGMRRWTDGKSWSASRVSGSFLTYREMEGKRGGSSFNSPALGSGMHSSHLLQQQQQQQQQQALDSPDGQEGYRYKPDGLVKQSFSILTTAGQHLHLISYYSRAHPSATSLHSPSTDHALAHIRPAKGMYPDSTLQDAQTMPAVTRSPMADSPYANSPAGYGESANHLRHPPPQPYGWPPSPHSTPPGMFAWAPGYFPPGFPIPPNGTGQMPFWANPAYFPQFLQQQQQNSQPRPSSSAQEHHTQQPGVTAFDRVPPPLRSIGVPPPPPPAPAHSYPQHLAISSSQGPNHPAFARHLPGSAAEPAPPYTQSSTYQSQYTSRTNGYGQTNGTSPHPPRPSSQGRSPSYPPLSPPLYSHPSQNTPLSNGHTHPQPPANTSKNIPSINALINQTSPPSRPLHLAVSGSMSNSMQVTPPDVALGGEKAGQKPGYGEDINALRRLDRAFAP